MRDRTWILGAALAMTLAIAWPQADLAVLATALAYLCGKRQLARVAKRLWPFLLPLAAGALARWYWGGDPWELTVRMLSVVLVASSLTLAVPPHRIAARLVSWRVPLADVLALSLRYVAALEEEGRTMHAALRLRGGLSTPRRAFASAGLLAGSLLVRGYDRAVAVAQSMVLRGGAP